MNAMENVVFIINIVWMKVVYMSWCSDVVGYNNVSEGRDASIFKVKW
jgi:hypothetical protein